MGPDVNYENLKYAIGVDPAWAGSPDPSKLTYYFGTASNIKEEKVATIKVEDLWAVFPELEGVETAEEFAAHITRAADISRKEDSYVELRERFDFAVYVANEHAENVTKIFSGDDDEPA